MFENVQKLVRKRYKVDNCIYAREKKSTIEEKRSTLLSNIDTLEMHYFPNEHFSGLIFQFSELTEWTNLGTI